MISLKLFMEQHLSSQSERDFIGFSGVYNHLRTRLFHKMIDAILVVKNNLDLFAKINFVLSIKNLKKSILNITKLNK